ncbi:MAG: Nif3-like dinuclear metal center hexameric protein [Methermicoccaceae archaeon]
MDMVVQMLEEIAPPELADAEDLSRIGLVVDRGNNVCSAAVTLDPSDTALEEAARLEVDILICHHPLLFNPVNRLSPGVCERLKIALENEISIYVMHTNFDRAVGGTNDVLASLLQLDDVERLDDMGCIGEVETCSTEQFAAMVSERLGTHVQFVGKQDVERVMVVAGSGFQPHLLDEALELGVDAYVSGELRHHIIRDYQNIALFDGGHYYTEAPAMRALCSRLPFECVYIEDDPNVRVQW